MPKRKPYPSDVTDEEWAFVAPYLTLVREDAPQRRHDLREVFDALRWILRSGAPWRMLPHDFPPWEAVYQQTQRWIAAGLFEAMVHDLRALLRLAKGGPRTPRQPSSTAAPCARPPRAATGPATTARSARRGRSCTWPWRRWVTCSPCGSPRPPSKTARTQVEALAEAVQEATGASVELAYVDRVYAGEQPAEQAEAHGIRLEVIKHPGSKKGFVLLPRRWVVERSFTWATRFRRLVKDYERLPETVAGLHFVAFACLVLARAVLAFGPGP